MRRRRSIWAAFIALTVTLVFAGCASSGRDAAPSAPVEGARAMPDDESSIPADPEATARLIESIGAGDLAGAHAAIAAGAEREARGAYGRTPLVHATKAGQTEIALALIQAGADVNAKDDMDDSAFLYAGAEGMIDIVRMALEHGAHVTALNRFGGTALIPAAEHAHVETVALLIAAGVPLDHVNDLGWTAMQEAIVLGDGDAGAQEVVRQLLAADADANVRDAQGRTPLCNAERAGFREISQQLRAAGGAGC